MQVISKEKRSDAVRAFQRLHFTVSSAFVSLSLHEARSYEGINFHLILARSVSSTILTLSNHKQADVGNRISSQLELEEVRNVVCAFPVLSE
jgi:hypothetical protein